MEHPERVKSPQSWAGSTIPTPRPGSRVSRQYHGFLLPTTIAPLLRLTLACPADFDDGTNTGTPDLAVTLDDLLYDLPLFSAGDPRADLDDGTSTGTPDGGITSDDLLCYLARYENGC
jgi:hypothetical protein